jgi:predicted alpha/beta-hydrolase family hydrolase
MPKRKTRGSTQDDQGRKQRKTDENGHGPEVFDTAEHAAARREEEQDINAGAEQFQVPFGDRTITCRRLDPPTTNAGNALIFTHGAGGGIDRPAVVDFATGYAQTSRIVCFQGSMNLKSRIKAFHAVMAHQDAAAAVVLGGRSMGARAAVQTALEMDGVDGEGDGVEALVLVSYPLLAGGKGERREVEKREEILKEIGEGVDVLFVVGSEDVQCDMELLGEIRGQMRARSWLCVVRGANHGMSMKMAEAARAMRVRTGELAAQWVRSRERERRSCELWWNVELQVVSGEWVVEV